MASNKTINKANDSALAQQSPSQKKGWSSLVMSFALHGTALVLLAIFFTARPGTGFTEDPRRVDVVLSNATESPTLFDYQDETDVTSSSQAETIQSLPPETEKPVNLPDISRPDLPGFEFNPDSEFDASKMVVVPQNSIPTEKFQLSEEDLKLIARDRANIGRNAPKGEPVETRIFGSAPLNGRRFIFVIDRSRSMGDSGLGVLDKARVELATALKVLKPEHSFQIVAYHQSSVIMGQREMLSATPQNKSLVPNFIQGLAAFGATRHENGLTTALTFRPDIVVLITDGGLPALNEGQIETMVTMAGSQTQIHCLQFGSGGNQENDNFMKRLAGRTDGSYRYINVDDWNE